MRESKTDMGETVERRNKKKGMNLPFWDWICWNLNLALPNEEKSWKENFAICLWWIWRWRNDEVFHENRISLRRKLEVVQSYSLEIAAVKALHPMATGAWRSLGQVWIGWKKTLSGWWKLNTDGSMVENSVV